jgi:enoyl-CoA hydratase/carnithine racemase
MSIRIQDKDGVRILAFSRPEKKNAITREMYQALADGIREAESNDDIRVMLFASLSENFTAGNDVAEFASNPPADENAPVFQFLHALVHAKKPLIAAVPGLAIGIGTTLLLHCDLVYCGESAKFKVPFVDLALVPEAASSLVMVQRMGYQRAAEMLLLGDAIDAKRAYELGLVNQVLPDSELLNHARAKAKALAAKPQQALLASKALMRLEPEPVWDRMQREAKSFIERLHSDEAKAIFAAFLSKK